MTVLRLVKSLIRRHSDRLPDNNQLDAEIALKDAQQQWEREERLRQIQLEIDQTFEEVDD